MFLLSLKTDLCVCGLWRDAHDVYTNPLARALMITLQVVRTSFGFHLGECVNFPSNFTNLTFFYATLLYLNTLLVCHSTHWKVQELIIGLSLIFRSENPWTGPASVKDAWKEISDVFNENKAASTHTPFSVTFIVLISIHFLGKKVGEFDI